MTKGKLIELLAGIAKCAVDDVHTLRERGAISGPRPAEGFWDGRPPVAGYRCEAEVKQLIAFFYSREWEFICDVTKISLSAAMRQMGFSIKKPRFDREAPRAKRPDGRSAFNTGATNTWVTDDES